MEQRKPRHAYFRGSIVPFEDATISVMTHALNYGTAVFGGLRGYWNEKEEELYLFRPKDHFRRLLQSASLLRMEIDLNEDDLVEILRNLLQKDGYHENIYIRPLIFKSSELIGVKLHGLEDSLTMFAIPFGQYVENEEGLHVCFSSWQRVGDNTMPARGKVAGSYVNSALIKSDAVLSGYDEALVLTADGHLSEGSAANVMIVRDGKLITAPVSDDILEGVTRRSILQLAQDELGIEVIERKIDRTEVYIADECFMCGTGMQIAAVTRIEHRTIGSGSMGPITTQIRDMFFDLVVGSLPQYQSWLTPVYSDEKIVESL